ncbi:hypothetical protein AAVH_08344 [Aphelenchoides avenae]|nr:hypothetical protein AAVH_08344 [Aphelenchus avenae]
MLPRRRRATAASFSTTSGRLVAACIVSFVLVSSCSWCAAQEVIDIAPDNVTQYYPNVSLIRDKYWFRLREEPVTVLLRTEPNFAADSDFAMLILLSVPKCGRTGGDIVLTNGWNPDCQLRFECKQKDVFKRMWTVYEKSGSEPSHLLMVKDFLRSIVLAKQADGTKIQDERQEIIQLAKDCVLEAKSLGGHLVYHLTFAGETEFVWNAMTTVFVRLKEPTTTPKKYSTPSNATNTAPEEPSAAGVLQLGLLVAAVAVMQ